MSAVLEPPLNPVFGIPVNAQNIPIHPMFARKRVKLRFRPNDFAYAYVREKTTTQRWALALQDGCFLPLILVGQNEMREALQ